MDYLPFRVSTLRGDQKIDFDAFVKIGDKYVLYVRRGDSFEGERLTRLRSKKLKKMFITPSDESNYRTYLTRNIEMAYDKGSGKNIADRAEIIQGVQQSNAEQVMEHPDDVAAYAETKSAASRFAEFIMNEGDALKHVLNIENIDQNIAHHGVTVSSLSLALAKRLGKTDPKHIPMLAVGALLHDLEHFHSGVSIARPLKDFTPEELAVYRQHPQDAGLRIQDKKHFDQQVIVIIAQHEEAIDGSGFPNGFTEGKLDPLSVMVASANSLDRLIAFEGIPRKDAARKLMLSCLGKHPLDQLQILTELIHP